MPQCLNIGLNLAGLLGNSPQLAPLNIVKQPFVRWFIQGATDDPTLMQVDADGYPTTMVLTGGGGTATHFILQLNILPEPPLPVSLNAIWPTGTYVLLYRGTGTVTLTQDATGGTSGGTASDGRMRVIYTVSATINDQIQCDISSTGNPPNSGTDYIRDIAVVYSPGSTAGGIVGTNEQLLLNGGDHSYWSPDFIAKIKPVAKCLRFMDWLQTNTSIVSDWANRNVPSNYSWCHFHGDGGPQADNYRIGVPVEAVAALCNVVGADAWVCMPIQATNDYITQFATLMLANLNPGLKCYVEYGNETWNTGLIPGYLDTYMHNQGAIYFPQFAADFGARLCFASMRMANTADLWAAVWTGGNASRLQRVYSLQNGNTSFPQFAGQNDQFVHNTVNTCTIATGSTTNITLSGWQGPNQPVGNTVAFISTGGSLPTGMTSGQSYFVISAGNPFQISATSGGPPLVTSGSATGTITCLSGLANNELTAGSNTGPTEAGMSGANAMPFKGMASSHCDVCCTAPYFGYSVPGSWSADADLGMIKLFHELNSGGTIPINGVYPTVGPNTCGGTNIAYTLTSDADWGNGAIPATPSNQTLIRMKIPLGLAPPTTSSTTLLSIANPCVVSWVGHGLPAGTAVWLSTTSVLPSPLVVAQRYFVSSPTTDAFNLAVTPGGTVISTLGSSQSGTQTITVNPTLAVDGGNAFLISYTDGNATYGGVGGGAYLVLGFTSAVAPSVPIVRSASNGYPCVLGLYSDQFTLLNAITPGQSVTLNGFAGGTWSTINGNTYKVLNTLGGGGSIAIDFDSTSLGTYSFQSGTATSNGTFSTGIWLIAGGGSGTDLHPENANGMLQAQYFYHTASNALVMSVGLKLVCYEGGQGLFPIGAPIDLLMYYTANKDTRMGTAYRDYYTNIAGIQGNGPMNHFQDIGPYGNFGFWPLIETVMLATSAKYAAVADLVACPTGVISPNPQHGNRGHIHFPGDWVMAR